MSKMYLILVVFLVNRIVSAQDSSDETKYIDLLPDKEKEEFLERIARRIFEGVQSKDDSDRVSGEVSDTQLDEHDEFVKRILEEESSNLRKSGVDLGNKSDNDHAIDEDDHDNEHSLEKKDMHDIVDDTKLIDLTLRDGKRNKRNSFAKNNENSKIIHVSVGNGETDEPSKEANLENDSMQDKSGLQAEDIQIKYFKRSPVKKTNELDVTTQSISKTKMIDFEAEAVKSDSEETVTTSDDNVNGSPKYNNKSQVTKEEVVNKDENIGNMNNNGNEDNNNLGSTQKIYESLEKEETGRHSEEKSAVSEAIESTTIIESTSPDVKPTVVPTTKKLSNENKPTNDHIYPNSRSLRYTVSVKLEDKKLDEKNITRADSKDDATEDVETTVMVEAFNDLDTTTDNNKEIAKGLEKLNSDVITTDEKTTHTAEVENSEVRSTTLRTEELTTVSLRIESEERVEKELNLKELIARKEDNLESLKKHVNNNKIEISSKELIGGEISHNMQKKTDEDKEINKPLNPNTRSNNSETKIKDSLKDIILKSNQNEKVVQQAQIDKHSYNLANDMIKALRTEIKPEIYTDDTNFEGLRALYETAEPNEYKVDEVSAGKQPFLEKDQLEMTNKENPHYVPIYNYSPNNAYYNPHNRLGPNADDDDEAIINRNIDDDKNDDLDENEREAINFDYENYRDDANERERKEQTEHDKGFAFSNEHRRDDHNKNKNIERLIRNLENYKNSRKFRFGSAKQKQNKNTQYQFKMPLVVQYPKFTDIILNPNDYLDMDYYYGRTLHTPNIRSRCELDRKDNKVFPDSTENDHPYNNMHSEKNLKDHMRSVRQLLYRQKHFGYIVPPNDTETNETLHNVESPKEILRSGSSKTSKDASDKNIAMDYFFGRMNADTDTGARTKKVTYSKYSNNDRYEYKNKYKDIDKIYRFPKNYNKDVEKIYRFPKNYKKNKKVQHRIPYKSYNNYDIKPATPTYYYEDIGPPKYHNHELRSKKKDKPTDFVTIKEVLSISDENDLLITLDKLLKLNLTARTSDEVDLETFVTVLEDFVRNNAKGLKQYDWLSTTVDIQSALVKLMDMTEELQNNINISQPDLQLLKYTLYLHKSTKKMEIKHFRKNKLLPRNKNKKKGAIKERGLFNRHWLFRMMGKKHDTVITKEDLDDFNEFLNELQYYLYDLHTAIQQISSITSYNSQRWFENLKELYINTKRKNILELLLHITTTRLLDLIEVSAKNGAEEDFLTYVIKNSKEVDRAKTELSFALKIIEELKSEVEKSD